MLTLQAHHARDVTINNNNNNNNLQYLYTALYHVALVRNKSRSQSGLDLRKNVKTCVKSVNKKVSKKHYQHPGTSEKIGYYYIFLL